MCSKPCKSCPWKKDSIQGYLGDNSPKTYSAGLVSDVRLQCHSTHPWVNHEQNKINASNICKGYLRSRVKSCKSSRQDVLLSQMESEIKESNEDLSNYFMFAQEFEEYHT